MGMSGQDTHKQLLNGIRRTKSGKTPEIARHDGVLNISDVQDTREQLEEDMFRSIKSAVEHGFVRGYGSIGAWLDRQAAITERELCKKCEWPSLAAMPDREAYDRIAKLTAERDEWKAKAEQAERAMNRAAGKWAKAESRSAKRAEAVERLRQLPPMDTSGMRYVRAMLGSVVGMTAQDVVAELIELLEDDELTAERDMLQGANEFLADAFKGIQAERDQLKTKVDSLTAERDLWLKRYQQAHKYALEQTAEKTCRIVAHVTDGLMTGFPKRLFEFSCGHSVMPVGLVEEPNCCSICGAKVVRR